MKLTPLFPAKMYLRPLLLHILDSPLIMHISYVTYYMYYYYAFDAYNMYIIYAWM